MLKLFTINTNIQGGVLRKKSSETLNEFYEKYLREGAFLVKMQALKMNSTTRIFQAFS